MSSAQRSLDLPHFPFRKKTGGSGSTPGEAGRFVLGSPAAPVAARTCVASKSARGVERAEPAGAGGCKR